MLLGLSDDQRLLAVMYVERTETIRIVSARKATRRERRIMKKATGKRKTNSKPGLDEILPEYDFRRASRNKYASKYAAGSAVVVLEPDVAAAFPSSKEALRASRGSLKNIVRGGRGRAVVFSRHR